MLPRSFAPTSLIQATLRFQEKQLSRQLSVELIDWSKSDTQTLSNVWAPIKTTRLGLPVLLMEFVQENLTSFLHHNPPLSSHLHVQVNISYDIALALHHLHSNGIIHRNISSNNILLSPSHQAKITDIRMFDFPAATSKNVSSRNSGPWNCAIDYMPPEAFDKTKVCNEKLDCFSAGVIGIQVITGLYPEPSPKFQRVKSSAGKLVAPLSRSYAPL